MRTGVNPAYLQAYQPPRLAFHRVIIPVYVPRLEGYYAKAKEVLELCVESLLHTIHPYTAITVINNGSCAEVLDYLEGLFREGKIDKLVNYRTNVGKMNSLLYELHCAQENFVTLADADVLFTTGWQQAVEEAFALFPNLGLISPLPQPRLLNYHASFSWLYGIISGSLVRISDYDKEAVRTFKRSIGQDEALSPIEERPFAIEKSGKHFVIGAGHFCCTIHKSVIPFLPRYTNVVQFKGAEEPAFDSVIEKAGFMRLATSQGFVFHMGNVPEPWMYRTLEEIKRRANCSGVAGCIGETSNRPFRLPKWIRSGIIRLFNSYRLKNVRFRLFELIARLR